MYDYDLPYVQTLCGLTELQRRDLCRWYSRLPESVRVEACRLQTDLIRQHRQRQQAGKMPEFLHAMLVLALQKMRSVEGGLDRKGRLTLEQARRISEIRLARAQAERTGRKSPTRHKLELQHAEQIKRLRGEGLSWREVAEYLRRYHRLEVSHTYLRRVFKESAAKNDNGLE